MSIEFQIAYACPHQMIKEPATVAGDGRTLQTSQTCAGGVKVYMNGIEIPPEGLHSNAKLRSRSAGPFRVYADARTFGVTFGGVTQELELDVGVFKSEKVAHQIGKMFDGLSVSSDKGFLVFEDKLNFGKASKIALHGSALETLGFDKQRCAYGKEVAPPWGMGLRAGYTTVSYPRFFYKPKQQNNARFEVTYFTEAHRCRRCMATRVENDLKYDNDGLLNMIKDEDVLYQACLKALLTNLGSNIQHKWYGSRIQQMIGRKAKGDAVALITDEIRRVLDTQMNLQEKQSAYQDVTLKERIYKVISVKVQQHRTERTVFLCEVMVQNYSGATVSLSIVYTAPEAYGLVRKDGAIVNSLGDF